MIHQYLLFYTTPDSYFVLKKKAYTTLAAIASLTQTQGRVYSGGGGEIITDQSTGRAPPHRVRAVTVGVEGESNSACSPTHGPGETPARHGTARHGQPLGPFRALNLFLPPPPHDSGRAIGARGGCRRGRAALRGGGGGLERPVLWGLRGAIPLPLSAPSTPATTCPSCSSPWG